MVLDTRGRCLPRHSTPISERESFVIFDDARCRGADLQLNRTAVGLLTLGPGLCKDTLMQAAGRLRQVGRGQTLRFVGTPDVTAKIVEVTGEVKLTCLHVLQWVMANTVQATLTGVSEWARQGLHFATMKGAPERAVLEEVLQSQDLYGGATVQRSVTAVVSSMAEAQLGRCGSGISDDMRALVQRIQRMGGAYGGGQVAEAGGAADEECERELAEEEEQEREVVKTVVSVVAARETDLNCMAALQAYSPAGLEYVRKLPLVIEVLQPPSMQEVEWSDRVFCTNNFVATTSELLSDEQINKHMRPIDSFLLFESGEILLVSEREADAFLELAWTPIPAPPGNVDVIDKTTADNTVADHMVIDDMVADSTIADNTVADNTVADTTDEACVSASSIPDVVADQDICGKPAAPILLSLCYASAAFGSKQAPPLAVRLGHGHNAQVELRSQSSERGSASIGVHELVSCRLFDGQASYHAAQLGQVCKMMFGRKEVAQELASMRGKQSWFPRSNLELACEYGAS